LIYRLSKIILICSVLFAPYAVDAQTVPGRIELTPYGAYSLGGTFSDIETDAAAELQDSSNFGLLLNVRQAANTQWEVIYSQQSTDADVTGLPTGNEILETTVHYLQGGGTYQGDGETVRPYLAATIGAAHFDVATDGYNSETFFAFSIGAGLQFWPNNRLGMRLEGRAFGSLVNSDSDLFCISDPANGTAGCAISVAGEVLWQFQAMAGVVFRF
jgi:opacity protein-like surface antigen